MVEDPFLASSANSELANVSFATDLIDPDDEVVAYWEKRSGEGERGATRHWSAGARR